MTRPSLPARNVKKRKATSVFISEHNSSDENWDSSSISAACMFDNSAYPRNQTPMDSEEDGESDEDLRDVVEQMTGRKVWLDLSNADTSRRHAHETEKFVFQAYDNRDGSAGKDPDITQITTGHFMRSLAAELREARERFLQWMRQEMQNFLQGVPSTPSTQVRLLSHGGHLEACVKSRNMEDRMLNSDGTGMHFGLQVNHTGGVGSAGENRWIDQNPGQGDACKSSGDGSRSLAHTNWKASQGIDMGSDKFHAETTNGPFGIDTGSGLEEENQEAECVNARFAVIEEFDRKNGIGVESCFPDEPGETDFGESTCSGGGLGYRGQQSGGTATSLKGYGNVRNMAEMGLCNSISSSNAAGKLLGMSAEESKNGYLGMPMHKQSATAELQNPSQTNLFWNMMPQSGRIVNQTINGSSSFGCDSERKAGEEGMDPYYQMTKNTSLYESSLGLINSSLLPSVNAAVDTIYISSTSCFPAQ